MAELLGLNLTFGLSGANVLFTVSGTIRFQPHELGTHWGFFMTFMEEDKWPNPDDKLKNTFGRTILADSLTKAVTFNEPLSKSTVDTEWGDEEVFVRVSVDPLEEPPPFVSASGRSNKVAVDV